MPTRWTAEAVLALAPDDSSRKAATGLTRPARWSGTGATADLVWGLCEGSGTIPYQIIIELAGPAYACSCPSRKFPCKHALGLLLNWVHGEVPDQAEPADYAAAWAAQRRAKAEKAAARLAPRATGVAPEDLPPDEREAARKREEAAAVRRAQRAERVASGLSELEEWLRDQVRVGLPAAVGGGAGAGGTGAGGHADVMAARMNDAMARGVGGMLRSLSAVPLSGEGWPARLLAGYAQLHLLIRAHERLAELPAGLAATVRSRIGYDVASRDVLAGPAVPGGWLVTGVRDVPDAETPTRRIWLRGQPSPDGPSPGSPSPDSHPSPDRRPSPDSPSAGRPALLLAFAPNGAWSDPDTAMLPVGTVLDADVHYYPGDPPLRVLLGARRAAPATAAGAPAGGDAAGLLSSWAAGIAADPWLTQWPALLSGTPVAPASGSGAWQLVDSGGTALPLRYSESLWTLLAVSGGYPVTVAGEWAPDGLTALTVWHGAQAVALL